MGLAVWLERYRILLLLAILLPTAVMVVRDARLRPVWHDEMFSYYTAGQPSVGAVVRMQAAHPVVLEPPVYDVVLHGVLRSGWRGPVALRSISIASWLCLQVCLFVVGCRLSGWLAGGLAALLPLLVGFIGMNYDYATEARSYAFVLALYGLSLLCWLRALDVGRRRGLSLCGVALCLLLAIGSHFYAVFLLVPFAMAELVRTLQRRAVDWPMLGALVVGAAGAVIDLPFLKACSAYEGHLITGQLNYGAIHWTYIYLLNLTMRRLNAGHSADLLLAAALGGAVWLCWKQRAQGSMLSPVAVLLLVTTLLPLPAVWTAMHIGHAYRERYVCYAIVSIVLLVSVLVGDVVQRFGAGASLAILLLFAVAVGWKCMTRHRDLGTTHAYNLQGTPTGDAFISLLRQSPHALLYMSIEPCMVADYYSSAEIRERLRCVYSDQRELQYANTNTQALTSRAIAFSTHLKIVDYRQMTADRNHSLVLLVHDHPWQQWLPYSLRDDGAQLALVGNYMNGQVYKFEYPESGTLKP